MFNNKQLTANRKATRILRDAFLSLNPYDAAAAAILSRAMDRVDNERRRILRSNLMGRRKPLPQIICEAA